MASQAEHHGVLILYCFALLEGTAEMGAAVQWKGGGLPQAHPAVCQDHPASMILVESLCLGTVSYKKLVTQ